ncbi:MAG: MarR family transcriptional regulator [Bacteroidota bacterium]|nr:MarR family transcriptional regulator [Bacteroidota bacterium]
MGTHYPGSKKEVAALNAYIKLVRATEKLVVKINSNLAKSGITERQFAVLEALFFCGPLYQRDLAKKLQKSGGNITLVVDNLEKQKLVSRKKNNTDRRFYSILLTPKGKLLIEKILPEYLQFIVDEMAVLTSEEQQELDRLCKLLGVRE